MAALPFLWGRALLLDQCVLIAKQYPVASIRYPPGRRTGLGDVGDLAHQHPHIRCLDIHQHMFDPPLAIMLPMVVRYLAPLRDLTQSLVGPFWATLRDASTSTAPGTKVM